MARHTALQFTVAEQFLTWLHQRDRELSDTRQAELEAWHVENLLHNQRGLRATNPGSRFLFPGRRPGQPIHPYTLYPALQELGVPTQIARISAVRQLVLQAPAPVIAQALGYHPTTAHRHAADAGGTWTRYVHGDHTRPQPQIPRPRTPPT